jgi:hypothetical protein
MRCGAGVAGIIGVDLVHPERAGVGGSTRNSEPHRICVLTGINIGGGI